MDMGSFQHRIHNAKRGDRIIYHTGDLYYERNHGTDGQGRGAAAISLLAKEAWRAYMDGKVTLTQQRIGNSLWAYIATRLDPEHPKKVVNWGCYADDPPHIRGKGSHDTRRASKSQSKAAS